MELRHLRYFVFVAEELHFGRAAQRAGIAQPPLSQQIRSLEAELGARLFDRTNRRVQLTSAGEALLPRARQLLEDARRAIAETQAIAAGNRGRLRLGFVGSLAVDVLPQFVSIWRDGYPDVHLEVNELTSEQQQRALIEQRIDLGFGRYPSAVAELTSVSLGDEPLLAAFPDGFLKSAPGTPVSVASMTELPLIIFPRHYGPPLYDQILELFRREGLSPTIGQEAIQMMTIVALVSAGVGCAVVPASLAQLSLIGVDFRRILEVDARGDGIGRFALSRVGDEPPTVKNAMDILLELYPARKTSDDDLV